MRKKLVKFVWLLLGAALLFNQIGINFLHDRHDAHAELTAIQKSHTVLVAHGDHCPVCSLETLFVGILPVQTELSLAPSRCCFQRSFSVEPFDNFVALQHGRGPPSVA